MTNALTTFTYNTAPIRVIDIDGEPWFVATDICKALNYSNPTMMTRPLDDCDKAKKFLGSGTPANIISRPGLIQVLMRAQRSNAKAKAFQDWVSREVIPSVMDTGSYTAPGAEAPATTAPAAEAGDMTAIDHMMAAMDHAMKAMAAVQAENLTLKAQIAELHQMQAHPVHVIEDKSNWVTIRDWCQTNRKQMSDTQKKRLGTYAGWIMGEKGKVPQSRVLFSHRLGRNYEANAYPSEILDQAHVEMRQAN